MDQLHIDRRQYLCLADLDGGMQDSSPAQHEQIAYCRAVRMAVRDPWFENRSPYAKIPQLSPGESPYGLRSRCAQGALKVHSRCTHGVRW
jgi:hypothetical protein